MYRHLVILFLILSYACDPPVQEQALPGEDPYREQFVKTNRYMQMRHQDHIAAFVERVGWDAEPTSSGLWILVDKEGDGPSISQNDIVEYSYSSSLLDGTPCYEASRDEPKQVIVGKSRVESGVDEALRRLKSGSSAILIIPPHLAHGNFGDRNKIPGNSILIYRLEIQEVRQGT